MVNTTVEPRDVTAVIDMFSALLLAASLALIAFNRLKTSVRIFAVHSLLLALVALSVALLSANTHILWTAAMTVVIKVILLPRYLNHTLKRTGARTEKGTLLSLPLAYLLACGLIILAYAITGPLVPQDPGSLFIAKQSLPAGTAIIFIGLFLMLIRRKAISQVIGLLIMENGLFLAALATTSGMPLIVEIGVFFDLVIAVIILGVLSDRLNMAFDTTDTAVISGAKEQ